MYILSLTDAGKNELHFVHVSKNALILYNINVIKKTKNPINWTEQYVFILKIYPLSLPWDHSSVRKAAGAIITDVPDPELFNHCIKNTISR